MAAPQRAIDNGKVKIIPTHKPGKDMVIPDALSRIHKIIVEVACSDLRDKYKLNYI